MPTTRSQTRTAASTHDRRTAKRHHRTTSILRPSSGRRRSELPYATLYAVVSEPTQGNRYLWSFAVFHERPITWHTYEAIQDTPGGQWRLNIHHYDPRLAPNYLASAVLTRIPTEWVEMVDEICRAIPVPNPEAGLQYYSENYIEDVCQTLLNRGIIEVSEFQNMSYGLGNYSGAQEQDVGSENREALPSIED
ncbi:hypothetical protein FDECE_12324 [Fusarium decemcellulare]|nr:hypothetical protein FDECE_12324 [Fusarium decemcellulare]